MSQTEGAHMAALRELAARLYRNLESRDGRVYWKGGAPRALHTWLADVRTKSPYTIADFFELCHVLRQLCGLVLDGSGDAERVTARDIADAVARNKWADSDANLLRWVQDDLRRIVLVDAHLEIGSVLRAIRVAQDGFRRDMAYTLLAALNERAARELAAWVGV